MRLQKRPALAAAVRIIRSRVTGRCHQIADHLLQGFSLAGIQGIVNPLPLSAAGDEIGITENLHMMRQGRLRQIQIFQEDAGTAFTLAQERQNAQPLFIA